MRSPSTSSRFALMIALAITMAIAVAWLPIPASAARPNGKLLVVIDPGHGGARSGAVGPNKVKEKDVALSIARSLRAALEDAGHEVLLTRDDDRTLKLRPRIELANQNKADIFLSIHANSMPTRRARGRVQGLETYFLSADATDAAALSLARHENSDDEEAIGSARGSAVDAILADLSRTEAHADSSRLAHVLHSSVLSAVTVKDRGVRQAPFFVLEGAAMPAVLVEVGYISHPQESLRISEPAEHTKIALSLATGLATFRREVLEKRTAVHGAASERASSQWEKPLVELHWTQGLECPSLAQVSKALSAVGVLVSNEQAMVEVSIAASKEPGFELELRANGKSDLRHVPVDGACDQQAALLAAVIERFARPIWEEGRIAAVSAPVQLVEVPPVAVQLVEVPPVEVQPVEVQPTPVLWPGEQVTEQTEVGAAARLPETEHGEVGAEPAGPEADSSAVVPAPNEPQAESAETPETPVNQPITPAANKVELRNWRASLAAAASVSFANAVEVRPGFTLGLARRLPSPLTAAAEFDWRVPRYTAIGHGRIGVEELRLAALLNVLEVLGPVRIDAGFLLGWVHARTYGLARTEEVERINPGAVLGVAIEYPIGPLGIEAGLRGVFFLRSQEFMVGGKVALELPMAELVPSAGLTYVL